MRFWRRRDASSEAVQNAAQVLAGAQGVQVGNLNTQTNIFGKTKLELKELGDPPPVRADSSPSRLLAAPHEVVPFMGRDRDQGCLAEWLNVEPPYAALLMTGPGGQGKTRLALKAARDAKESGKWRVLTAQHVDGSVRQSPAAVGPADKRTGVLVLVDYADRWSSEDLVALFRRRELTEIRRGQRVRVLLLARSGGLWAIDLLKRLDDEGVVAAERPLDPVNYCEDGLSRQEVFRVAAQHFARELKVRENLVPEISEPPALAGTEFELMLSVQVAALATVLEAGDRPLNADRGRFARDPAAASEYLIEREVHHWAAARRGADTAPLRPEVMRQAVFVATLTRGLAHKKAITLLDTLHLEEPTAKILREHALCYPPLEANHVLEPLYPDLLGEDFLAAVLPGGPPGRLSGLADTAAPEILSGLFSLPGSGWLVPGLGLDLPWPDELAGPVMTELIEVSRHWEHVARLYALPAIADDPLLVLAAGSATLGRLLDLPGADECLPAVGAALDRVIGVGVNVSLDAGAVLVAQRLVDRARSRGGNVALAQALTTLSIRQRAVGDVSAALDSAREAVGLAGPGSPGLAVHAKALTVLAMALDEEGEYAAALQPAREAVGLYRRLAERDDPDQAADLPGLGAALVNLAKVLSDLGEHQEAVDQALTAVSLYQAVDQEEYDQLALASALTNLAALLSDLGKREEALGSAIEAVDLYRKLPDPGSREPALALALANLGGLLSDLGRHSEALSRAQESEVLYRKIRDSETGNLAYLAAHATALTNVSRCLSELGRHAEAVDEAREAVALNRQVAYEGTRAPAVTLPALAATLLNLGTCLFAAGDHDGSLEVSQEAISFYWQLARSSSATAASYLPDLALALANQGIRLTGLGRHAEALPPMREAISVARLVTDADAGDPAVNLGLAASLQNLAAIQFGRGQAEQALNPAEEAITTYRRLIVSGTANPNVYLSGLAASLIIVSDARSKLGRSADALEPAEEAVLVYRALAAVIDPAEASPFPAAYASALHHLGVLLWELERRAEAVGAIEEAISIRRRLTASDSPLLATDADAQLAALAAASHHLGMILCELDRRQEALPWVREAVRIRDGLTSPPSADTADLLPGLAASLHNLAAIMSSLGQQQDAADFAAKAVFQYRSLTEGISGFPGVHLPDLADALRNYSGSLFALGRTEDALQAIREAVGIYRTLTDNSGPPGSAAFLPGLAQSVTVLALVLEHDDLDAATGLMSEAVGYWTTLVEQSAEQYKPSLAIAQSALALLRDRARPRVAAVPPPPPRPRAARAVGIDLGTTNSVVAVLENGVPTVVPNAENARVTPSVVAFAKNDEVLVGEVAKRQAVTNVNQTIVSVKRTMGTDRRVSIKGKELIPQQISAFILQKLKRDAEAYLGETVTDAVITVPAYFNDAQRQATKEAGQIAGLNVLRIINEPTAAALAYRLHQSGEGTILVFDLGGGTFDVSLLEVVPGVVQVRATSGDPCLGGDDWDQRIVDWLARNFMYSYGIDLSKDKAALQRLRETAEKTKVQLSGSTESRINLPYIAKSEHGPLHLDASLSRAEFQEMTADLLDRCRVPFWRVIDDAHVEVADIDHVILVGGSTRMPAVGDLVRELTGGREPNKRVNPDEVVAVGACLQAGVVKGDVSDILLLDVTPLSLGIQTMGVTLVATGDAVGKLKDGFFTKVIERNAPIPNKKSEIFTTAEDNQPTALIQVFQGEREMTVDNKKLGKFALGEIPPEPRGVPQIEVTFDLDHNGILNVSARNLATGKQQSVTISEGYTLDRDDLERMKAEADRYAAEDRRRREEAEIRDRAQILTRAAEESLSESTGKVPASITAEVSSALASLKKTLDGTSADAVLVAFEEVDQVRRKMQTAIFAQTQRWAEGKEEVHVGTPATVAVAEVWPRSFADWTNDPEGHADQSLWLICRTCGDRWNREPDSLPADLQQLRGPYTSPQEAECARAAHIQARHSGGKFSRLP